MFLNELCEGLGKEMECSLPEIVSCFMKQVNLPTIDFHVKCCNSFCPFQRNSPSF